MASTMSGSYEHDFYAWALKNAELIRQGRFSEMDTERVAEEIEDMGRSIKRALVHRLAVLFAHQAHARRQHRTGNRGRRHGLADPGRSGPVDQRRAQSGDQRP